MKAARGASNSMHARNSRNFYYNGATARGKISRRAPSIVVIRDQKLKLEDRKASHTLGGGGEGDTVIPKEGKVKR